MSNVDVVINLAVTVHVEHGSSDLHVRRPSYSPSPIISIFDMFVETSAFCF